MIPKDSVINALRALGYTYKRQAPRTEEWKLRGGTKRVHVPRNKDLDPKTAESLLLQAGMPYEELRAFLKEYLREH